LDRGRNLRPQKRDQIEAAAARTAEARFMPLKGSKTEANLKYAFGSGSAARLGNVD